jgi:hypothetical protein
VTIDERLDRLTERHNTLIQTLQEMIREQSTGRGQSEQRESAFEKKPGLRNADS